MKSIVHGKSDFSTFRETRIVLFHRRGCARRSDNCHCALGFGAQARGRKALNLRARSVELEGDAAAQRVVYAQRFGDIAVIYRLFGFSKHCASRIVTVSQKFLDI
ncbi:MAG TPA: hypothetical protein VM934_03630 [Pyrinomonadaceae bacterium]|nr:hypothetical protein [Pyrinomonadaceae bacterium]